MTSRPPASAAPSHDLLSGSVDPTPRVPGLSLPPRHPHGPTLDGAYIYRGSGHRGAPVERNEGAVRRVPPPRTPETGRQRLMGHVWEATWEAARRLPHGPAFALARLGARLASRIGEDTMIRRNLARVVAEDALDEAVVRAYDSYGRYHLEAFRAADLDPGWLDRRATTGGFHHLDGVLEQGRGAIILLAHHGSWDIAARWAESHGYHLAVVAEVLRPRKLFSKFVQMREALGLEIVPLRRGDNMTARLATVLRANHLVGLLSDRDLTGNAPVVELFGEPARIPAGPALLSRRVGTPIVPITMLQRPGMRYHLQVLQPFTVADGSIRDGVQRTAQAIEELVRLDPAQWHAFQPVFEADRDG